MGVKVAVVGGGSTYTPELVDGFVSYADRLPVDELALLDVDDRRLEIVGGLARRILARRGWTGELTTTTRLDQAVDGATFVVVQLRVGGQDARLRDESLPLRHGCLGQETTGPGGFAKALRTVPVVLDIADEVARRGDPGAWLLDFTNPVGIVSQALHDAGHRAIGLCNVAIGFERRFAELLDVPHERIALGHVGLNHLTWERSVVVDGVDRLPELLQVHGETLAADLRLPVDLVRELGAIPSYYLRYYYLGDRVLAEQRTGTLRAAEVKHIERDLLERYQDPELDVAPPELASRGGAYYSQAAVRLMASLHDGAGDVQVVDVANQGAVPGLPDDAVVEVPARIDRDGAHTVPVTPLPPELAGLIGQVKAYEQLAAQAAITGDRGRARLALLTNPLVTSYDQADALLADIIETNRDELPRFAAR
jgi:6-phospho-beta-glucosidase